MAMSVRRTRQLLWSGAALLLAATAAGLVLGLTTPFVLPSTRIDNNPRHVIRRAAYGSTIQLADFRKTWSLRLQQPLYDPPKPQKQNVVFQPPPLQLKLQGIVQEPGHTQAILTRADGRLIFKGVGETIGNTRNAKIVQIGPDSVQLSYYERIVTLKLPVQ